MRGGVVEITSLDHIVLSVKDVAAACCFYQRVLGLEPREERPGKWSLHFGTQKISLQLADQMPAIARRTMPGSGNFCLLTKASLDTVLTHLAHEGVVCLEGPAERMGGTGPILSVYFYDPDGNLVEVSRAL